MKRKLLFLLILNIIFFSCNKNDTNQNDANIQPGVVLCFDDDYVNEWYDANTFLQKYQWKATFFVSHFNQLSPEKIQKLKDLKKNGHEIGGHGLNHIKAPTYIATNGTIAYLNQEIYPMVDLMNNNGLPITSFAYPDGSRNATSDELLLNKFQIIRGTSYSNSKPSLQECYYNHSRMVFGLGIDKSYPHFNLSYFISLLEYAKSNHKIVVFYAHKPVQNASENYQTDYQTLSEICKYVKENTMKFYKISELYSFNSN